MPDLNQIARMLKPGEAAPDLRQGVVQAITGTGYTCTVTVGGATTPLTNVRYLSSNGPVVGQTVLLLRDGPDWLVVGTVAGIGSRGPGCLVRRTALQTIANSLDTVVTFQAAAYNVGPCWSSGTNPSRITFPLPGRWAGKATLRWTSSASTAERYSAVRVNGNANLRAGEVGWNPSGGTSTQPIAWAGAFALNDYIELVLFQATGGNLDAVTTFVDSVSLQAEWLGPA